LEYGLDLNNNGTLDSGEIDNTLTNFVCNGSQNTSIPSGAANGQILTYCNGQPTWTSNGICPGILSSLNCGQNSNNGVLIAGVNASGVNSSIAYNSSNGGSYNSLSIQSTGVTGLTATLPAGQFSTPSGTLTFTISGIPSAVGTAAFAVSIGGQSCSFTRMVFSTTEYSSTHSCGANSVHNNTLQYGTMSDQQGNTYKTILIGNQEWMAENLNTSIYRNGDQIPTGLTSSQWANATTPAWCYYGDNPSYQCPHGKLYNWYAVADSRNLCPVGWHVPTDAEWQSMANILGGLGVAGGKMKSAGLTYWTSGNAGGTNLSGFSAIASGNRSYNGSSANLGTLHTFWSSTPDISTVDAVLFRLHSGQSKLERFVWNNRFGFSVRCKKD
jgi:uncharacterized protein (TIGR02145 family)